MALPAFVALNAVYGWRACFLLTSALGVVWLAVWLGIYRAPATIEEEAPATRQLGWMDSLRAPQTWGFALGKFLSGLPE